MSDREFSVIQYFKDDSYEYVRRFVTIEEAVSAVKHYTHSVGARLGFTKRVIITDGGDCIVFEWTSQDGVLYPKEEEEKNV